MARSDDEMDRARRVRQQLNQQLVDCRVVHSMVIVQHEYELALDLVEFVDHRRHQLVIGTTVQRGKPRQDLAAEIRK